jgi:hypothetical protein
MDRAKQMTMTANRPRHVLRDMIYVCRPPA